MKTILKLIAPIIAIAAIVADEFGIAFSAASQ